MTGGQAARIPLPGFSELDQVVAQYRPLPGVPDEFIGADGKPKGAWLTFISRLIELGQDEIQRRFALSDRQIRDTGMSYRAYGDKNEKSWPIGHLPLLIEAEDWREISAGVVQRAELLERVLQDIYGDGRLIAGGAIPAAAVAGCPDYLQPVAGVLKPGEAYLHIYAAELGRGPDGKWWVLGDRTQAPSGTGYALANRLVLSRTFPNLYRDMNVERLAPFFDAFRTGLAARATRSDPRICLLTPGPYNETYFEQAYLARYLGLLLVEGGDLTVRDGVVNVRTIAGLKRADVILRRIDSDFADPLELNGRSRLGVPGLLDVLRSGGVTLANALGSGVVESPVMMSFMPRLCREVLGEDLLLPNIATWWCGQGKERDAVLGRLDEMALAGAYGNAVPGGFRYQTVIGATMSPEDKAEIRAAITARGIDYVGQEVVKLSTTPVYKDGQLAPRPFTLRVYAARTPSGWTVMPGGFCRVSHRLDARAVTMGMNAESADVWVLGTGPIAHSSLLPSESETRIRRMQGNLPSRAADNLFWFGRYLERAEAVLRIVRALSGRFLEVNAPLTDSTWTLERLQALLDSAGAVPDMEKAKVKLKGTALAAVALFGKDEFGSAFNLVEDARRAASFIRERLSSDTWRLIEDVYEGLKRDKAADVTEWDITERVEASLRVLTAISGLSQENMNRGAGWVMLDIGRRVERAINTCRFARQLASKDGRVDGLSVLLDLIDSQITYRSRYLVGVSLVLVRDMVLLDPYNPRSVAFQVDRLSDHLANLPRLSDDGMLEEPRRLAVKLSSELTTSVAADLDNEAIFELEQRLLGLAEKIGARYFLHGASAVRAEKSMSLA
jgi:uncharacterized circularly permuted ATP-grasp superfamily protein/uncharacterized alpha-E superfamily protein